MKGSINTFALSLHRSLIEGDFRNLEKQSYLSSTEIKLRGDTSHFKLTVVFLLFVIVN